MKNLNTRIAKSAQLACIIIAAMVLSTNAIAAPAPPSPILGCGTLITVPGSYYLAFDLVCQDVGVLIATSKVDLDLKKHTISITNSVAGVGIVTAFSSPYVPALDYTVCANVSAVRIHGGTISGAYEGVLVCSPAAATSGSTTMGVQVDHMILQDNYNGVNIAGSNKNVITNNFVKHNDRSGIVSNASFGNEISSNLIECVPIFTDGITVYGGGSNKILNNAIHGADASGIFIGFNNPSQNEVRGNFVDHSTWGIVLGLTAVGNIVARNTVFDNVISDLRDDDPTCTLNTWDSNFFGTGAPGCTQ